jgi:hypothetical protein
MEGRKQRLTAVVVGLKKLIEPAGIRFDALTSA